MSGRNGRVRKRGWRKEDLCQCEARVDHIGNVRDRERLCKWSCEYAAARSSSTMWLVRGKCLNQLDCGEEGVEGGDVERGDAGT